MRTRLAIIVAAALIASTAGAELDGGVAPTDASAKLEADPRRQTLVKVRSETASLDAAALLLSQSGADQFESEVVAKFYNVDLKSPDACEALARELGSKMPEFVQRAQDRAAILERVRGSYRRPPKAESADALRIETLAAESDLAAAQVRLRRALAIYLRATQGARTAAEETARAEREDAARQLDERREEARQAEQKALMEAQSAVTAAQQDLGKSRAALEGVRKDQLDMRRRLLEARRDLQQHRNSNATVRARLSADLKSASASNATTAERTFREISASLDESETVSLPLLVRRFLGSTPEIPRPPDSLPSSVAEHSDEFPARVAELQTLRDSLAAEERSLRAEALHLQADEADHWHDQAVATASLRVQSLARLREPFRSQVFGLTRTSLTEVQSEGALLAVRVLHYLDLRAAQLREASGALATLRNIVTLAIGSIELLVFIGVIWWAMRRWKLWMRSIVSAMGRYIHLGGWPLIVARVADALQSCGPPLILAAASAAVFHFLGGPLAPAEIQVGYILIFWVALFRGQQRFLVGFASNLAARREQAAGDRREESAITDDTDASQPAAPGTIRPREYHHRAGVLFKRTWQVLTWYAASIVIGLELIELGMDAGVFAHHYATLARVAALPILLVIVHWWRAVIVSTYSLRADTRSAFGSFVVRHGGKPYGAAVALVATPVLLITRGARLVREHIANLNATRQLLAFLFRRQVERHAEKTGQDPTTPSRLPEHLVALFPTGPLSAEQAPLRPASVDEIEQRFAAWREGPVDGSVALVGDAGMGKTTILGFLATELEAEVTLIRADSKLTRADALWQLLGSELAITESQRNEDGLVAAIKENRTGEVIAIDDSHNLFMRRVGGFEAWRALTRVVNATCADVFWIVALNDVSWGYLLALEGGISPFRAQVPIHGVAEESLRKLMLSRMRMGRYRTSFSDLLISDHDGMRRSTQIIRTSRGYFSMLWDYTRGNPRLANHYWLRSLVVDGDTAKVRLFSTPPIEQLEALRDEAAFTLAAIVEHENVNATELAVICNLAKDRARFLLQLCYDKGMLVSPTAGRYEVSTHWQVAIYRFLRRRNLLYA